MNNQATLDTLIAELREEAEYHYMVSSKTMNRVLDALELARKLRNAELVTSGEDYERAVASRDAVIAKALRGEHV